MAKGRKRGNRRGQDDPTDAHEEAPPNETRNENEEVHKNLLELTADELKKEAFKLGLFTEGEKPRKDQALTKLTAFLSRSGINIETFQFSPNGATKFPAPLLTQNRAKITPVNPSGSGTSSSESGSGSSSDSEDPSVPKTSNHSALKKKKKSKANNPSTKSEYETLLNPVTGVPVGVVSRKTGQFYNIAVPGSAPVTTMPTTPHPATQPAAASVQLSGHDSLFSQSASTAQTSYTDNTPQTGNNADNTNLDICGVSIPGFAQNKSSHTGSSCTKKLTSGMFCTGRKEVRQKIVWPHHCVNSIIKPNGVEYDVMNWQELTNGFTGLILSKANNQTMQPDVLNMLRHLNLISGYGMFAPMKTVLDFNAGLMLGIENMSQDWFNWTRLKQYHDQHLHSLKLSANLTEGQSSSPKSGQSSSPKSSDVGHGQTETHKGGGPGGSQRCSKTWLTSQNVCFLYQNDKCDQELSHDDGKGNTLCHCCGWCYYNWKGLHEHSNATCPDKKNPFRPSRLGAGRTHTGNTGQ